MGGLGAFGYKSFHMVWGLTPAWTYLNARPGYTVKTRLWKEKWRSLYLKRRYCNLHVTLLQMIYTSIRWDTRTRNLLIQNFPFGMGADACLGVLKYLIAHLGCTVKPVWGRKNAVIVNQITLLQSTRNSVSNDTLFVMLRCLVSKPLTQNFSYGVTTDACLSKLWYLYLRPGYTVTLVWGGQEMALL